MVCCEDRFDEELLEQFRRYRAELRHQFCRSCWTYAGAMLVLLAVSSMAIWALLGVLSWTLLLAYQACCVFGRTEGLKSDGFRRWQSRQVWVEAGKGDSRSLKRLQNVQ